MEHAWISVIIDIVENWPIERQNEWNNKAHEFLHNGYPWDKARIAAYLLNVDKYIEKRGRDFKRLGAKKNERRLNFITDE